MAADRPSVTLQKATLSDSTLLSNLLELYTHDLSAIFSSVELGPDGRFGHAALPRYWAEPDRRFAFLIWCDERVAGFALATRGSPASDDPDILDVAEFFVLRRYRRSAVGARAAFLLWEALPGKWLVRVSEANRGALAFWSDTVEKFTNGAAVESTRPGQSSSWRVFSFETAVSHLARLK